MWTFLNHYGQLDHTDDHTRDSKLPTGGVVCKQNFIHKDSDISQKVILVFIRHVEILNLYVEYFRTTLIIPVPSVCHLRDWRQWNGGRFSSIRNPSSPLRKENLVDLPVFRWYDFSNIGSFVLLFLYFRIGLIELPRIDFLKRDES